VLDFDATDDPVVGGGVKARRAAEWAVAE
jgi:hypothetical protein